MQMSREGLAFKVFRPARVLMPSRGRPSQKSHGRLFRDLLRHGTTRQTVIFASTQEKQYLIPPDKKCEVDNELWELLDICNNDELENIHNILYGGPPLRRATGLQSCQTKHRMIRKGPLQDMLTLTAFRKGPQGDMPSLTAIQFCLTKKCSFRGQHFEPAGKILGG
jgi:hypothetical protein